MKQLTLCIQFVLNQRREGMRWMKHLFVRFYPCYPLMQEVQKEKKMKCDSKSYHHPPSSMDNKNKAPTLPCTYAVTRITITGTVMHKTLRLKCACYVLLRTMLAWSYKCSNTVRKCPVPMPSLSAWLAQETTKWDLGHVGGSAQKSRTRRVFSARQGFSTLSAYSSLPRPLRCANNKNSQNDV